MFAKSYKGCFRSFLMGHKKNTRGGKNIVPFSSPKADILSKTKPRGNYNKALIEQRFPEESAKINDLNGRISVAREKLIRIRDKDTLHDRWIRQFEANEGSLGRAESLLIEMIKLAPASKEYEWRQTAVARIFNIVNKSLIGFSRSV